MFRKHGSARRVAQLALFLAFFFFHCLPFLEPLSDDDSPDDSGGPSSGDEGDDGTTVPSPSSSLPVAGVHLWLQADSMGSSADGSALASWTDSSGNTTPAQSTVSYQPLYRPTGGNNGHSAVEFDGTDDHMVISDGQVDFGTNGVTLIVAVWMSSWTSGRGLFTKGAACCAAEVRFFTSISGANMGVGAGVAGSAQLPNANALNDGQWNIAQAEISNTGTYTLYVNGTSAGSSGGGPTPSANANALDVFLGAYNNAGSPLSGFGGRISEVIVYQSVLSLANRESVACYLASKYAITVSHACP